MACAGFRLRHVRRSCKSFIGPYQSLSRLCFQPRCSRDLFRDLVFDGSSRSAKIWSSKGKIFSSCSFKVNIHFIGSAFSVAASFPKQASTSGRVLLSLFFTLHFDFILACRKGVFIVCFSRTEAKARRARSASRARGEELEIKVLSSSPRARLALHARLAFTYVGLKCAKIMPVL